MPAKIAILPFVPGQQQILFWGRRVGYCGDKPHMPVCFLTDKRNQCGLTEQEKIDVIAYVDQSEIGPIKSTPQTEAFLVKARIEN